MRKLLYIIILLVSGVLGLLFSLYVHKEDNPPMETKKMETFHYPARFVKQLKGDPDAGRKIFNEFCGACHSEHPPIDVKAPLIGDKKAWEVRKRLGVDVLLKITIHGVGAMPARGGCFECSDAQLREAIEYILESSYKTHQKSF